MTQSIKIPIQLEVQQLQGSINYIKKALDKLDPGTNLYKSLEKGLNKVIQQMNALEVESKQSFGSVKEIENFEKNFNKVGTSVQELGNLLNKVSFSDLGKIFSKDDLQPIENAKSEIDNLQKNISKIKTDKMFELTRSSKEFGDIITKLGVNTFDKAVSGIEQQVKNLTKSIDSAEASLSGLQNTLLTNKNLSEQYNKVSSFDEIKKNFLNSYQKDGKQLLRFKAGGREQLTNILQGMGFDDATLEQVKKVSIDKLEELFQSLEKEINKKVENQNKSLKRAQDSYDKAFAEQETRTNLRADYNTALDQLRDIEIDPTLQSTIDNLNDKIEEQEQKIIDLQKQLLITSGIQQDGIKAQQQATDTIEEGTKAIKAQADAAQEQAKAQELLSDIKFAIKNWFGFNEVINLTKNAVRNMITQIRELDDVMTQIAIVTDMTQQELWDQMDTYSAMAQQYGASIKGVYEVSQLYYQQGLQTAEVMNLTEETLKMAKIANLDYAEATDYMTVALRGFKLEMSNAQQVTDVYSALAAATASDTEELAVAMSKTASSAEAVGSSFESTSAMIATMISITREAPENIGSALKSIISRYGEMTSDPMKLVDSEGEEMSLNKVDKALQSVGISLQDAQGQFRDFDDVILELSKSWDTIDTNTQRYIATVMAGNRQQSRFLALVGNYEEYAKALEVAENAEDAGTLQTLKTMDSISTKWEQLKVSLQEFYTSAGLEDVFKGVLDALNAFLTKANDIPKLFGKIPVSVIALVSSLITSIKNVATSLTTAAIGPIKEFNKKLEELSKKNIEIKVKAVPETGSGTQARQVVENEVQQGGPIIIGKKSSLEPNKKQALQNYFNDLDDGLLGTTAQSVDIAKVYNLNDEAAKKFKQELNSLTKEQREALLSGKSLDEVLGKMPKTLVENMSKVSAFSKGWKAIGKFGAEHAGSISLVTSALSALALTLKDSSSAGVEWSKTLSGGLNSVVGAVLSFASGQWQYAIPMLISGIPTLIDGLIYTTEEKLKNATEKATELSNTALQSKSDYRTLKNEISELEDLTSARYNSAEAMQEYLDYSNQMADKYPELIDYIDSEGNAVLDLSDKYNVLEQSRLAAAEAAAKSAMAELEASKINVQKENESQADYLYQNLDIIRSNINDGFATYTEETRDNIDQQFSEIFEKAIGEEAFEKFKKEEIQNLQSLFEAGRGENFLSQLENDYSTKNLKFKTDYGASDIFADISTSIAEGYYGSDGNGTSQTKNLIKDDIEKYASETTKNLLLGALEGVNLDNPEEVNELMNSLLGAESELISLTNITDEIGGQLSIDTLNFINSLLEMIPDIKANERAIKLAESQQRVADNQALSTATYWKGQELLTGDNKSSYRVLDEMSTANKIIADYLKEKQGDLSFDDYYNDVEKFDADYTAVTEQLADLWNNLLVTGKSDELNQIIGDLGSYSENSLREALNNIGVTNEENINLIISSWEENYSNAFENFKKARKEQITKLFESSGKHITGGASLGDLAPKYYASVLEQFAFINSQVEKNIIEANQGQIYANNLTSLWEKAETDLKFGDLLQEADLTSLSGIYDFRQAIIDAGYSINDFDAELSALAANIKINVVTETDSLISKLNTSLKTFGEEIAKAGEGMDLEEALKVAEKLDMSIADFKFEDGEFKMEGSDNFQKLYDAYVGENKELQNQLKTAIDNEIKNLEVKQISTLGYSFTKEDGEQLNQLRILRDNLDKIVGDYNKQLLQTFLLQNKSYQEYFNNLFADKQISEADTNELIAAARQGEQEFRNLLTQKGLEMTNASVEAFMGTIEGTYDDIISIINEGKGLVSLTEFDWSPEDSLDTSDSQAVQEFYQELFAGNHEKFNEAWIGYLENQEVKAGAAIADIASSLDSIDVSAIGKLADSLGLYVTDLIKYFNLNEDGTYSASANNIRTLMSDFNIKTTSEIEDALREYLNNIISILTGGIEGSATKVEINSLQEYLNSTGAEIEVKTFETAEGLKITENSILQIYSHLKNINSLAAKTTLETLAKTAMDSDESMNDVYKVLKKIDDLESKPSNERTAEYEAQLDICKEVLKTLQKADDTFNFMNRDLPSGIDDPLSAWEGMGDAFKVLDSDDFKAGRIAYQDYYNMITQMEAMGVDLSSMASGFNTNAERAAALLQAGGKALSNVDGETFVDLSKLGTNFNIGAEGMKEGLTEGIHTLAQNQIDILDAEIALLETVVKTQEAFDSISGEDNEIDISELMPQFNSEGVREWSENQEEVISFMASYAGETIIPTIDGTIITINDLYSNPSLWDKLSLSGKKLLTNFSNALKDIIGEQDWSTLTGENSQLLQDKINQILKDLGINQKITIDPDKVTKGITFVSSETSGDIYTKLSEAFGSTWSEIPVALKSNLVKYIQEKLSSSEEGEISLTLSDLIDFIVPEGTNPETQALRQQLYASLTSTIEEITPETVEGTTTTVQNKVNSVTKATLHGTWTAEGVSGEFGNQEDAYNAWLNANKTTETETLENVSAEATLEISAVTETKLAEDVQPEAGFELTGSVKVIATADPLEITSVANPTLNLGEEGTIDVGEIGKIEGTASSGLEITIPEGLNADSISLINQFNSAISAAAANATVTSGITVTITGLDEDGVSNIKDYNGAIKELPTGEITSTVTGDITIPLDVLTNILALKNAVLALKNDPSINATISATAEKNAISLITDILSVYGYSRQTAQLLFNATDNETINAIITELEKIVGKEIDITANLDDVQAQKDLADLTKPETKVVTVTYQEPTLVGPGPDASTIGYHVAGIDNNFGNIASIGQYSKLDASAVEDITAQVDNGTFQNGTFTITEMRADGTQVTTTATLAELQAGTVNFSGAVSTPSGPQGEKNRGGSSSGGGATLTALPSIDTSAMMANIQTAADSIVTRLGNAGQTGGAKAASAIQKTLDGIKSKTVTVNVNYPPTVNIGVNYSISVTTTSDGPGTVKGKISSVSAPGLNSYGKNSASGSLAKGNTNGKALVSGTRKTLMGELGPELVVSNGRYFVVGQNGAEFVDLADDAIVFNHLQTKKLLNSGSSGYGKPITNERNAVSFATGNVDGPAMASASAALAQLRQIRAMWQALLGSSAKDLGSLAGSGGGGGGGGQSEESAAVLGNLDKWYNLLRQIDSLEQHITLEQAKRANMQSGYDYAGSLEKELDLLKKQQDAYKKLAKGQKEYYDSRMTDVNESQYGKFIFTYDKHGLMQYIESNDKEKQPRGLDILAELNRTDKNGKAKYKAQGQLDYLKGLGFDISVLGTNPDGSKAETAGDKMQNFWDSIDSIMEEMDGLYDSYHDATVNFEESTEKMNEILQEYIDNQLEVEQKLMQAIQDREQAEIDRIQDEKDALEEASQAYIDGLNEALSREKDMYSKNEEAAETSKLQRRLSILQRSGGSTSEIKALQEQIDSRLKDAYFQEQQDQIDAIQKASDNQLEKLQTQIDLMTETLEYQKEHGLLWNEVYEMMNQWTPEQMIQFIEQYTKSYQEDSALQNEEKTKETQKQIETYEGHEASKLFEDFKETNNVKETYGEKLSEEANKDAKEAFINEITGGNTSEEAGSAAHSVYRAYKKVEPEIQGIYEKTGDLGMDSVLKNAYLEAFMETEGSEEEREKAAKQKMIEKVKNSDWGKKPEEVSGKLNQNTYLYKNPQQMRNEKNKVIGKYYETINKGKTVSIQDITEDGFGRKVFSAKYGENSGYIYAGNVEGNENIYKKFKIYDAIQKLPSYASGGDIDFTGLAMVHGSKNHPENILNAEHTKLLKQGIFSNSNHSLVATLKELQELQKNIISSAGTSETGINIEHVSVEIQPGVISNDYEARRAGEMALEEMVRIARKTTNRVISR